MCHVGLHQAVRLCSRAKKARHATYWAQALLAARRLEEAQEAANQVGAGSACDVRVACIHPRSVSQIPGNAPDGVTGPPRV
jgi:hypothetical protein